MAPIWFVECQNDECMESGISNKKACQSCGSSEVKVNKPTTKDIITAWESDLENANRHSLTEMPTDLYGIMKTHIKDEKILFKIFLQLYESEIGI
jgi:hypothetical protein